MSFMSAKPRLIRAILVVLLLTAIVEVPIVCYALITSSRYMTFIAFWLGVSLWAVGVLMSILYSIRFLSGKYGNRVGKG